jgi:nucleotide-binding universal stress UspA family protein
MVCDSKTDALTLLLPLDGSRLAESVLPLAQSLGRHFGARFVLVHVIERKAPAQVHGDRHLTEVAEAQHYLAKLGDALAPHAAAVESHVHEERQRDVARSIVEHAHEIDADLILMCTHGRGGLRELFFGTIAQQALERGRRPILLVQPRPNADAASGELRRILVPLDGSAAHEAALAPAVRLARGFGAELELLLVVPTARTLAGEQAQSARMLPGTMRAVLELAEDTARGYLEELVERCRAEGVAARSELLRGDAVAAVADAAARRQVDLLVLGSHGRCGFDALLAGSVAARIAGRTALPLLLVPAGDEGPAEISSTGRE